MSVQIAAKDFFDRYFYHVKYVTTMKRSDPPHPTRSTTSVAFNIDRRIKGVYFFYPKGQSVSTDPMHPIYIGETIDAIQKRLANHKRSLNNPAWKTESTGKKFIAAGIDLDTEFDVYYIDAELLNINTRQESILAETSFMVHLKPLVWKK
jgi:hypothetical protein